VQPATRDSTVIEPSTPKPEPPSSMPDRCKALITHPAFDAVIVGVILITRWFWASRRIQA
jgi:hypothetical protein